MKPAVSKLSLDTLVNLVMLATCLVLLALVLSRPTTNSAEPNVLQPGDSAELLPGVNYQDAERTLLLYLRSSCSYCTSSMPFYRTLSGIVKPRGSSGRILAVGGETTDAIERYLAQHSVTVDQVISHRGIPLPTPTLFLVDNKGTILKTWIGQLDEVGERDVSSSLFPEGAD